MGNKLLFFFPAQKAMDPGCARLAAFFFFLTTWSPLFIKWHPESSASYFFDLNTFI